MISSDLLRVIINYKNNKIQPNLCNLDKESKDYEIAVQISNIYQYCFDNSLTKEKLNILLKEIENTYKDFKLIRGLSSILERRCVFTQIVQNKLTNSSQPNEEKKPFTEIIKNHSAIEIRKIVFEESALQNIAITEQTRDKVFKTVSDRLNISKETIPILMWSDLEENMVVTEYVSLTPEQLLLIYNISLIQTLFFNCLRLRIKINVKNSSGTIWKNLLWQVKRSGLMYWLEIDHRNTGTNKENSIICIIDGSLNILKMTERYGNAIAKLLPTIIRSQYWNIEAEIIRITSIGKKKIYYFEMSEKTYQNLLPLNKVKELYAKNILYPLIDLQKDSYIHKEHNNDVLDNTLENTIINTHCNQENNDNNNITTNTTFDSLVEKNFMHKFEAFQTGWTIEREPEPIITKQNAAFISDFVLSKYEINIFVEIIGYWTSEYLERKITKIGEILENNKTDRFFMILIINFDNLVSYETNDNNKISQIKEKENVLVISYKKNNVPFKEIITFLRRIEEKYFKQHIENISDFDEIIKQSVTCIKKLISSHKKNGLDLDNEMDEYLRKCIKQNINLYEKLNLKELLKRNTEFAIQFEKELLKEQLILMNYSIYQLKFIKEIFKKIRETKNLKDATVLLSSNNIPEKIHIDLLDFMGFRIDWNGLDYTTTSINLDKNKNNEWLF